MRKGNGDEPVTRFTYAGVGARTAHSRSDGVTYYRAFFHADRDGNVTCLTDENNVSGATYGYDPFGRTIGTPTGLAAENACRFSSKDIAGTLAAVARDPDDNAVLECALTAPARFIITGDEDLLVLDSFDGVEILRAAGACVVGKPVKSLNHRSQRLCPGPRTVRR